eukprot:15427628-Alexandrium_andersonii.AAC.1
MVIKQDERKGFALQRFSSSDVRMNKRMGITHGCDPDTSSTSIRDAVVENLKRACTPRLDPPRSVKPRTPEPKLDVALFKHCCSIVEFYCPDGASDEQRAG